MTYSGRKTQKESVRLGEKQFPLAVGEGDNSWMPSSKKKNIFNK